MELPTPPVGVADAPSYDLSNAVKATRLTTIEYPAQISLAATSISTALSSLTPPIDKLQFTSNTSPDLELDLAPNNPYSHKVPASTLDANNIVLKITKRRRKVPRHPTDSVGEYRIEPIAIEERLVRFRAMADFQYVPRFQRADPVLNLVDGIRQLDIKTIRNFKMPEPHEDFASRRQVGEDWMPPPPVFTRHGLPQNFDFRPAGGAVRVTTESGLTRLVNSTRYKTRTIRSILFADTGPDSVPREPDPKHLREIGRTELNPIESRIKHLLDHERPVWTRLALLNQLSRDDLKFVSNNKSVWPMVGYTFSDGPFRDLIIRFGYDPRVDPAARFYQHFILRNLSNARAKALPGTKSAQQAASAFSKHHDHDRRTNGRVQSGDTGDGEDGDSSKSHIFDGVNVYSKIGNFQLIDIVDPLSRALVDSTEGVLPACSRDANEGWYAFDYLDQIRQVVRRKFMALVLEGRRLEDRDCDDLLGWELSKRSRLAEGHRDGASGQRGQGAKESRDATVARRPAARRRSTTNADEDDASSQVETSGSGQDSEEGERETGDEGDSGSGPDSETQSEAASGTDNENSHGQGKGTRKGKKPTRAPWELPKRRKGRPMRAETEEDMLARLQRKARRSTTTGLATGAGPALV